LSIERDRLPDFQAALAEYAEGFPEDVFEPTLHIDALAPIEQIDDAFVATLEKFEPFGPDNAAPLLASLDLEVIGYPRRVGKNHLKLSVRAGERNLEAIAWGRSSEIVNLARDVRRDMTDSAPAGHDLEMGTVPRPGRSEGLSPFPSSDRVPRAAEESGRTPPPRFNNLDICYTVGRRTWGGRTSTQLTLRDFRTAE
jgi:hypothetical protein